VEQKELFQRQAEAFKAEISRIVGELNQVCFDGVILAADCLNFGVSGLLVRAACLLPARRS
jgi:hypothetical protein